MQRQPQRIGVLGGSFDPIHIGHLLIAEIIREELGFQKVLFIPAKIHPLKNNTQITAPEHRLKMVELAVASNPYFQVSDIEIRSRRVSYTVDTIRELKQQYPQSDYRLYFLMGQDNVNQLHLWKDPHVLVRECQIIAFGRPGFQPATSADPYLQFIQFLRIPLLEISATEVRERLRRGRSVRYMVPDPVMAYIRRHRLYRT